MTQTNPLLWAHYADNHQGVCLLRIDEFSTSLRETELSGWHEQEYGASPLRNWFKTIAPTLGEPASRAMGTELCKKLLARQKRMFGLANEVRAIREADGSLEVQESSMVQICFGLRTSDNARNAVRACVTSSNVGYCQIVRDETRWNPSKKDMTTAHHVTVSRKERSVFRGVWFTIAAIFGLPLARRVRQAGVTSASVLPVCGLPVRNTYHFLRTTLTGLANSGANT